MSMATSLDIGVAQALVDSALARQSGILTATRGKLKRLFCLQDGTLVWALSNVIEEQFTEVLLRDDLLSAGDLAASQKATDQQGLDLARLLVDNDVVPEDAMQRALNGHVRELLFSTLDWPDGDSSLERGRPDLNGALGARLSCVQLLSDYARQHPDSLDEVRKRIGSTAVRLIPREERTALLDGTEAEPVVRHLLAGCDGATSIQDLVTGSPQQEETTWRSLYAMVLLGMVEPSTARRVVGAEAITQEEILAELDRVEGADYYAVLDVAPHASRQRVLEAYYTLARKFHPDRFGSGPFRDLRPRVEAYFAIVTEAYNTLYDMRLRNEYDEQRAAAQSKKPEQDTAYLARENFRRAQALIAKGRFTDAVTSLENAIKLDGGNAAYRVELGQLLARNPRLRPQAEEQLLEANRIDPSLVDGYLALGDLYLKTNRRDEAIHLFREVLRWEPGHAAATERLQELGAA
jgi:tetratricopeptide (TPR) repeat protein